MNVIICFVLCDCFQKVFGIKCSQRCSFPMRVKNFKKHTQMRVSERAAWVGVGYYEHKEFAGAANNSESLDLESKVQR